MALECTGCAESRGSTLDQTMSSTKIQETYMKQGYLSSLPILSNTELREARYAFSQLERELGEEYTQYSLHNVHMRYEWVNGLARHPRVLEVVTAILGPDVILLDSRFICKYPQRTLPKATGMQPANDVIATATDNKEHRADENIKEDGLPYVAWHQDMRYWGIDGGPVLSVWLALDDSLQENGALLVIPGSHHGGMLLHRLATRPGNMLSVNQEIPEELLETQKAELCPLLAGEMSVHDGLLVHASGPNMSQMRRCGFVIRYIPTCAHPVQDPDRLRTFPAALLVSGTDRFNHFSASKP